MGPKAKRWRGAKGLGLGEQRSTGGRGGEGEGEPGGWGGAVPGEEEVRLVLDVGRGLGRVIPKGPTALPAAAVEWCGGREERGSHPAPTPPSGGVGAAYPSPSTRASPAAHTQRGGLGGRSLCSHLVAVSLTKTWLRREEQLNSNSSRKVTWGAGDTGSWQIPLQGQLQRNRSPGAPFPEPRAPPLQPAPSHSPSPILGPDLPWPRWERRDAPRRRAARGGRGPRTPPSPAGPSAGREGDDGSQRCGRSPAPGSEHPALPWSHAGTQDKAPKLPILLLPPTPRAPEG